MFIHATFFVALTAIGFIAGGADPQLADFAFLLPYFVILVIAGYHHFSLRPQFREWEEKYGFTWSRILGWYFFEVSILIMSGSIASFISGFESKEFISWIVISALGIAVLLQIVDVSHRSTIKTAQHYGLKDANLPKIKHLRQHPFVRNVLLIYLYVLYAIILSSAVGMLVTQRPLLFLVYFGYLVFTLLFFLGVLARPRPAEKN